MAPDILAEMFAKKMEQHPDLLERLLDTYPLPLIEACTDDTWGGGAPFESDVYDSDEPLPGRNLFGDIATNYRNDKVKQLRDS